MLIFSCYKLKKIKEIDWLHMWDGLKTEYDFTQLENRITLANAFKQGGKTKIAFGLLKRPTCVAMQRAN